MLQLVWGAAAGSLEPLVICSEVAHCASQHSQNDISISSPRLKEACHEMTYKRREYHLMIVGLLVWHRLSHQQVCYSAG